VKDIGLKEMTGAKVNGKNVLVAIVDGQCYALGNVCTHMGCELSYGLLNGENVTCACHGSVFNVKTGSVVRGPAKKPTPTFEVKVEGDQILVNT
jgi:nitrite reductase/ring-hydroxylating ferredoxin subunit